MTYTIYFDKTANSKPYSIHLGTDLFYTTIDFAATYEKAVEIATTYAKASHCNSTPRVLYTEGLFAKAVEIAIN